MHFANLQKMDFIFVASIRTLFIKNHKFDIYVFF